jgi:type II secretion system (T2SS) protein M
MRQLAPRESRLVAVGILVALIAAIWFGLIEPVIGGFVDRAGERRDLLATYARNERVLAGIAAWREQADSQKETARDFALVAPTEALAAEMLKQRLNRLTGQVGGTVQSVSDIQADVPTGWVRVRADLQLTMSQLYKSLARLESEAPYVVVGYVSVAADRASQTGHLATMDVRVEISAPVQLSRAS